MLVRFIVLVSFAISPAVGSVVRNNASIPTCRNQTDNTVFHERYRRQAQCGLYQWQCRDGTCISVDGKCDGKIDCPDKSDETHALCRNALCQRNWFRCTYGACVDGTAPCNGVVECADQSDELLPRCRNDTSLNRDKFRCLDGNAIPSSDFCDGIPHCPDGSDETVSACAGQSCPAHLFQCAYGACVDQDANCNGRKDCADDSDESAELCNKMLPASTVTQTFNNSPAVSGKCVLPPYPKHGTYVVANAPYATPGQGYPSVQLNISCQEGYGVVDDDVVFCQDGTWSMSIPQCVPLCKLEADISVKYFCLLSGPVEGRRLCNQYEPSGTVVRPECNRPNYFSSEDIRFMTCESDGNWNRIVKCKPECGRLTPDGVDLIIGGKQALRGELPWHVAIYRKPTKIKKFYELICGGSLVANGVVISAAHCFWDDIGKQQPASKYAVATAKLFGDWDHEDDKDAQKSELKAIHMPTLFLGAQTNFQEDIAVLILETPFVYETYVRPVCLNFDVRFNDRQLRVGNLGKVAGWGLTGEDGPASPVLKVVEMPYVSIAECIRITPLTFTENITGDKICAGYNNGTAALCKGDSGGGLAFPEVERGTTRYYLRGIVSTAPRGPHKCNAFTNLMNFKKRHIEFSVTLHSLYYNQRTMKSSND